MRSPIDGSSAWSHRWAMDGLPWDPKLGSPIGKIDFSLTEVKQTVTDATLNVLAILLIADTVHVHSETLQNVHFHRTLRKVFPSRNDYKPEYIVWTNGSNCFGPTCYERNVQQSKIGKWVCTLNQKPPACWFDGARSSPVRLRSLLFLNNPYWKSAIFDWKIAKDLVVLPCDFVDSHDDRKKTKNVTNRFKK